MGFTWGRLRGVRFAGDCVPFAATFALKKKNALMDRCSRDRKIFHSSVCAVQMIFLKIYFCAFTVFLNNVSISTVKDKPALSMESGHARFGAWLAVALSSSLTEPPWVDSLEPPL